MLVNKFLLSLKVLLREYKHTTIKMSQQITNDLGTFRKEKPLIVAFALSFKSTNHLYFVASKHHSL